MQKKIKVGIIGIRGLPAMYGAFDRFVDQLINFSFEQLNHKDLFYYVGCDQSFKKYNFEKSNIKRIFVNRGKGLFILISYFNCFVRMYFSGVRCFIFFGYGAAPIFPILKLFKCKIICNPDGIEWRRPESKIKISFFMLCEKLISKLNIIRIFDSKVIERYYKINHKALGSTVYYPSVFEDYNKIYIKKRKFERFYIIGRLLEENNTSTIVDAFINSNTYKKLYIIGNSNEYFTREIIPKIKKAKNIFYLGAIYDAKKLYKICNFFDYYIHGHSVGGTNPTLIEAINLQKKIISYKTFFNKEILGDTAAFFKNKKDLIEILNKKDYLNLKTPTFKKEFYSKFIFEKYIEKIKN